MGSHHCNEHVCVYEEFYYTLSVHVHACLHLLCTYLYTLLYMCSNEASWVMYEAILVFCLIDVGIGSGAMVFTLN